MASPLENTSQHKPFNQPGVSQPSPPMEGQHNSLGKVTQKPGVKGTPGLKEERRFEFTLLGKGFSVSSLVDPYEKANLDKKDGQYHPPHRSVPQYKIQILLLNFPEMAQPVFDAYERFREPGREHKMHYIEQLKQLVQPSPNDDESKAAVRKELKQIVYEWAHAYYDNTLHHNKSQLDEQHVAIELGYTAFIFAIMAEDEHPGAACRMAINTLTHGIKIDNFHLTNIHEITMGIAVKHASNLDISDPRKRVFHISQGARAYSNMTGDNSEWRWTLLQAAKPFALQVPAPDKTTAMYWDQIKEVCIYNKLESEQQNNKENAQLYNEQGLEALHQSSRHNTPTYHWDNSLLMLGLPMGLDNTKTLSPDGALLYDCQRIERVFRACSYVKYDAPGTTKAALTYVQDTEQNIRLGLIRNVNYTQASIAFTARLFGSPLLAQNTTYAEQIFKKIPGCQNILRKYQGKHIPTERAVLLKKISTPHESCDQDSLLFAKLLYLRGIEAEAKSISKRTSQRHQESEKLHRKAQESYLASAHGGFAGGYTKLALGCEDTGEAEKLLYIATEKGDISAWQSKADQLLSQGEIEESQKYYKKALDTYKEHGFEGEAAQIEELLDTLSPTQTTKKAKKKKKKATEKTGDLTASASATPTAPEPARKVESSEQTLSTQATGPSTSTVQKKQEKKKAGASATPVPHTLEAALTVPTQPVKPHINGRMADWAEQILIMHNDAQHIIQCEMKTSDSKCNPVKLTQEATIGPFSRFCQIDWIQKHPESHFYFSTWMILRINMNDERCALFCNTNGLERKHAETNMKPHLEKELKRDDVSTVEILITRDPCSHNPHSEEAGGCWELLKSFIKQHPETQWHIRFIRSNQRHFRPKESGTKKFVRAFDETTNTPKTYNKGDKPLTIWQEQVLEAKSIPNLSYAAVPTRNPEQLKEYYGENGVTKFSPEEFNFNPHLS